MCALGYLDMDRRAWVHGMDVTTRCERVARTILVKKCTDKLVLSLEWGLHL